MPPEETLYPEKTLIYQICKFLSDKKREITGLGGPLNFKLKENFKQFFELAKGNNDEEKTISIYDALVILNRESFGVALDRNVINILNLPNKENFIDCFNNDDSITIQYSTENLDDYVEQLKGRTRVAIRKLGLAELESLPSGGVNIILGDKKMKVTKSHENEFNLSSNIVKLMFNGSVAVLGATFSLEEGYQRKDFILFTDLLYIISKIKDEEEEYNQPIILKSIKDAVSNLNKRSIKKFEHPLFEIVNEGLFWTL